MGEAIAVLSLLLFSCNVILTKSASSRLNVQTGYFISICVNVIVASLMVILDHVILHHPFHLNARALLYFVVAGCFTTFLGRLTYFHSIVRLGASKASTFQVANPVFTVILAWLVIHETMTGVELLGCVCTVAGILTISYVPGAFWKRKAVKTESEPIVDEQQSNRSKESRIGLLFALLSVVTYGIGNIFRGEGIRLWNDPIFGGLVGAVMGLIAFLATNPRQLRSVTNVKGADPKGILMYAIGGVCTIYAQICVLAAMKYMSVGLVTVISMSQPLLVIPLSVLVYRGSEKITLRTAIGCLLALVGLVLAVAI
ncbi:DMT family transporter [Alicyclobacillus dauci]|uniref:DMT family transporter n=1 Tax=Alicyclobacillus dauci TaxID=1475485 RepID=A0ABY6YZA5_9BACL|nr:DMT family transporter [Alicyclobacillus dauci]WAH35638.1 DMT family transporter [Alicyclobacillus dauci]